MIRTELLKAFASRPAPPEPPPSDVNDDDDKDDHRALRIVFIHDTDGAISESDLIVATEEQWAARPESKDDRWGVVRAGGKVYALSLLLG
jgi:hypothetical protein